MGLSITFSPAVKRGPGDNAPRRRGVVRLGAGHPPIPLAPQAPYIPQPPRHSEAARGGASARLRSGQGVRSSHGELRGGGGCSAPRRGRPLPGGAGPGGWGDRPCCPYLYCALKTSCEPRRLAGRTVHHTGALSGSHFHLNLTD